MAEPEQPAGQQLLSDDELIAKIHGAGSLPRHVAVIMDGNGRWARKRFLPRVAGHRAGRQAVRRTIKICSRLGIDVLTLYTFSQENWKRPAAEVSALWSFLEESLASETDELHRNHVRLEASGDLARLPPAARQALQRAIKQLADNDGLVVNLALAYGGRTEILQAAAALVRRAVAGELKADAITEHDFRQCLYAPHLPDPDLVIRTSGEFRLSNFLLWQAAYAEFHVTSVLWPDFRERDLLLAVLDYQRRERRFGEVPARPADAGSKPADWLADPQRWKRLLKVRS